MAADKNPGLSLFLKPQNDIHWIVWLLIFCLIFLSLLPASFVQDTINIDHFFSSHHMFEYAFKHHFNFGIDIIDNVGPYGYLHYPYTFAGGAFWTKMLWFALICAIYAYYTTLLTKSIRSLPEKALFIFAIIFFPMQIDFPWYTFEVIPRLAVLFSALYCLTQLDRKSHLHRMIPIIFNGVFYALFLFEKASNVYYLSFLVALLSTYWIMKRCWQNILCLLTSFIGGSVVFWLGAGQKLSNLPVYFVSMRSFIDAYQNVMTSHMNTTLFTYALFYFVMLMLMLAVRTAVAQSWREFFQSLLIAALVFLTWKHGMLRSVDSYGIFLYTVPCLFAFLCFYPLNGLDRYKSKNRVAMLRSKQWYFIYSCGLYVIFLLIYWHNMTAYERETNHSRTVSHELYQRFYALLHYEPTKMQERLNAKFSMMKHENALPMDLKSAMFHKTVDEFGDIPELILLNDLYYSPRPVPINFIVANKALNEKNGRFYQQSQSAPDFVLLRDFTLQLTDTEAYLSLLLNYHVRQKVADWLVLEKNMEWNSIHLEEYIQKQIPVNSWVYLGRLQSFFTWIEIDLQPTLLGKCRSFLYKPGIVHLEVIFHNGAVRHYSMSLPQLRSGFLINPVIKSKDPAKYIDDNHPEIPWDQVKAFRITMSHPRRQSLFQTHYNASFSIVNISRSNSKESPLSLMKAHKHISLLRGHAVPS